MSPLIEPEKQLILDSHFPIKIKNLDLPLIDKSSANKTLRHIPKAFFFYFPHSFIGKFIPEIFISLEIKSETISFSFHGGCRKR